MGSTANDSSPNAPQESKPAGKAVGDMDGKLIATQSSAANDDDIDGVPMEDVAPPGRLAPAAKDDDDDDIDGIPMD